VATTKRVYKGKTYVTHLLRRSLRQGQTVTHETLGNLSHLPDDIIHLIKRSLKELDLGAATEDALYSALDWLLARQRAIERKLARRHLSEGALVLYDVRSSFYEGKTCPLARSGHDREGQTGCPIIVYGLLTDAEGRPIAVQVYPGHTGDPTTVPDQVEVLTKRFGLARVVLVGDRGMLTQTQINMLKKYPGRGWISALRSGAIRRLLAKGRLIRTDLEAQRLAEITSPEFPDERLVACYNPQLAEQRRHQRQELLAATEAELGPLAARVAPPEGPAETAAEIGVRAGKIINKYKIAKHFILTIREGHLSWARQAESIQKEELLDGIYVIRTSEPAPRLTAADGVRTYKRLALVEQAFRCLKGIDRLVRPIHHRAADRVRAHILLCLLAFYVEWHLRRAWEPLWFEDEDLVEDRPRRDPVRPARSSESARQKKITHRTPEGLPVQSVRTLLAHLGTRCRSTCVLTGDPLQRTFHQVTEADALQAEALRLIKM
jgi:transposase